MRAHALAVALVSTLLGLNTLAHAQSITVDVAARQQTMLGWNATLHPSELTDVQRTAVLDELTDLGLTSFRLHVDRREWEDVVNDNADPYTTNWSAYQTTSLDRAFTQWVVPLKQRIEARGERLSLTLEPSFYTTSMMGDMPQWMYRSPAEYTEWATNQISYIKNAYGVEADYFGICNEAGNANVVYNTQLQQIGRFLGPRMQQLGFNTKIQFASFVNTQQTVTAINALRNDSRFWPYVGMIAWHDYNGANNADRNTIRAFAQANNIATGMTEYNQATINELYDDLTQGNASVWSQFTSTYYGNGTGGGSYILTPNDRTSINRQDYYWRFYQVMHYVRPGDVRVEATSPFADIRALAFVNDDTQRTTVLISGASQRTLTVAGLTPGATYGVSQSTGTSPMQERGLVVADATGQASVTVAASSVLTLYPYAGTNQAPKITTYTAANPYLRTGVGSSTTVSATATDPELNPIQYSWMVAQQPVGASVQMASPTAASSAATGLTFAGTYVFRVTASDGAVSTQKDVTLMVYDRNNAPIFHPEETATRNPPTLTLPASTFQIEAYAYDIERSPLSYTWTIDSQPAGASATIASPNTARVTPTNLSVEGDYLFRCTVSDGTDTAQLFHTVHVWPQNLHAPYLGTLSSSLVNGCRKLSASGGDVDGDAVTYWWSVVTGAGNVYFGDEGLDQARLTPYVWADVAGQYQFRLTAIDRTLYTEKYITVNLTTVPEPATLAMLILGGAALLRRKSRTGPRPV